MSMLAERKVKQRWTLNPRGTAWSEDSNKFGQKLMEKMGWSKGKGLGAKEDGMVDHVKLSYKNDSKGMGYKETGDQWTEHETNFSALLESLSGDKPPEKAPIASLERKSQSSRVRVHYKKFTRGKDLSRCSDKDLAQIFGRRSLKPEVATSIGGGDAKPTKDVSFIQNGGSMVDYFKRKLPNFGKNTSYKVGSNGVLRGRSDSEEERAGFGFAKNGEIGIYEVGSNAASETESEERAGFGCDRKRKRLVDEDAKNVMSPSMKQAKKKRRELEEEKGLSNPAFDPLFGNVQLRKHALNTIEEEDEDPAKRNGGLATSVGEMAAKKKKVKGGVKTIQEDSGIDNSSDEGQRLKKGNKLNEHEGLGRNDVLIEKSSFLADDIKLDVSLNDSSGVQKKKKKIKKEDRSSGVENPNFDSVDDAHDRCRNINFEVKRKKKKKIEEGSSGIENPTFDSSGKCHRDDHSDDFEVNNHSNGFEVNNHSNGFEVTRKTKKIEDKSSGIENPTFDLSGIEDGHSNDFEVKRKKKTKGEETPNRKLDSSMNGCHGSDFEVKRTKKKREDFGVENPIFDEGDSPTSHHNNNFEIRRKKKKKGQDESFAVDNPTFDNSENGRHGFDLEDKKTCGDVGVENHNFDEGDSQLSHDNNEFEVKRRKKKKNPTFDSSDNGCHGSDLEDRRKETKSEDCGVKNPNFDEEDSHNNDYEVKRRTKKKSQDESFAIDNPNFDSTDDCQNSYVDANCEVKRPKKKKKKSGLAIDNPNFEDSIDESVARIVETLPNIKTETKQTRKNKKEKDDAVSNREDSVVRNEEPQEPAEPAFDLMLNITSIPTVPKPVKPSKSSTKRRKSVRFSEITEERIIPNNDDAENRNELFDINSRIIEAGLDEMSKKIDGLQAELENDINEAKVTKFIGEVGNPDGENEKLPNATRLKFKYAKFGRTAVYHNKNTSRAQTSYKHLIKGDIVLGFNNTNLHAIGGYGVKKH